MTERRRETVRLVDGGTDRTWCHGMEGETFRVVEWGSDWVLADDFDAGDDVPWRHIPKMACTPEKGATNDSKITTARLREMIAMAEEVKISRPGFQVRQAGVLPFLRELLQARAQLERVPIPIMYGDGKQGWTLNYKQILQIFELARNIEPALSMEDVEAVMLAMIDQHHALTTHGGSND